MITCGFSFKKILGSANCDAQIAGFNSAGVFVSEDDVATYVTIAPDAASNATGVVSDITIASTKQGYALYALEDSVDVQGTSNVADNGSREFSNTIAVKTVIDNDTLNWADNNLNKKGYYIFEDAENQLWAMYGLLRSSSFTFGLSSGDERSQTLNFENTKNRAKRLMPVDLTVLGTHANNAAFLTYLTTVAA